MKSVFKQVNSELQRAMRLSKCRKCGCMRETLGNLKRSLPSLKSKEAKGLLQNVKKWLQELEPLEYACFGCKYCIPPEAMTVLTAQFPSLASATLSGSELHVSRNSWPPVAGEYTVLNSSAPVAVSTLSSDKLEVKLAKLRPAGLCIVGKTETENIGIDKIVKNVIANPAISILMIAGNDTAGHQSGGTLLALWKNGVGKNMRIIGSTGRRPVLKNVSLSEVNAFRRQVQVDNQIGSENVKLLAERIKKLSEKAASINPVEKPGLSLPSIGLKDSLSCGCHNCCEEKIDESKSGMSVPEIKTQRPRTVKLDKAGYFVIIPSKKKKTITVEHYSYGNKLLRTIEGRNSRDIYSTIISNKWITDLGHAAYIGKELARAEFSIKKGLKFVQDGA